MNTKPNTLTFDHRFHKFAFISFINSANEFKLSWCRIMFVYGELWDCTEFATNQMWSNKWETVLVESNGHRNIGRRISRFISSCFFFFFFLGVVVVVGSCSKWMVLTHRHSVEVNNRNHFTLWTVINMHQDDENNRKNKKNRIPTQLNKSN